MLKNYFWKEDPIISVLIFNCSDVVWDEFDGNQTIKNLLYFLKYKYNINKCHLEINNTRIFLKKDYYVKLKNYVSDFKSLTIKINY